MSKVLFLADPNSPHIQKWARALHDAGYTIAIFGMPNVQTSAYENYPGIKIYSGGLDYKLIKSKTSSFKKIVYLTLLLKIRRVIKEFSPDILHAHVANSYGFFGALQFFHPYLISVWGSDIYTFPKLSYFHRKLIEFNLSKADFILSTTGKMAEEVRKYTDKKIYITPFGIDVNRFKPQKGYSIFEDDTIVIGLLKSLTLKYGIDTLIRSFKILKENNRDKKLKLLICGEGPERSNFTDLINELNLGSDTILKGNIEFDSAHQFHNMMTIPVYLSKIESFGVSVLEASACEKAVVASNVGGLPELVKNNKTGLIVNPDSPVEAVRAIQELIDNEELRFRLGKEGRQFVVENYSFEKCIEIYKRIYENILQRKC